MENGLERRKVDLVNGSQDADELPPRDGNAGQQDAAEHGAAGQSRDDVAQGHTAGDKNVQEVHGLIRQQVLVHAVLEGVEQGQRVHVKGKSEVADGWSEGGRGGERREQEVHQHARDIGDEHGRGLAPALHDGQDLLHGPCVEAHGTAHEAYGHAAGHKDKEHDLKAADTVAVEDVDAGQVAEQREDAEQVYGVDAGPGLKHEAQHHAGHDEHELLFLGGDSAHAAGSLSDIGSRVTFRTEVFLALHQPHHAHGGDGVNDGEQGTVPAVFPEVHRGAVLEQHGEGPDEAFGRMQEQELGAGRSHEGHEHESGRHARLGVEAQGVDNASGYGAEDDKAGQDRGEHEGEHEAARQEAEGQTHEAASSEGEAAHGQTAGQPALVHGFANDHGGKGYPRKDRGPRAEDDFSRGHVAKHIGKAQKSGDTDGGKDVEGPCKDSHAGHGHIKGSFGRDVGRCGEIDQYRQEQGQGPAKHREGFHSYLLENREGPLAPLRRGRRKSA